jgi:hypothetical protein
LKSLILIAVVCLAGCAASPPRTMTVNDLYEAKLSEMRAENAMLHDKLDNLQGKNPCLHSLVDSYDKSIVWVKQEYRDIVK